MGVRRSDSGAAAVGASSSSSSTRLKPHRLLRSSRKRGVNLSRKEVVAAQRAAWVAKQQKVELAKKEARRARSEHIRTMRNKQTHKEFNRDTFQAVREGLVEAITALREPVTPLSLFMAAWAATVASTTDKHHLPYILAILSACVPQLSQGVLLRQVEPIFERCEQLIAENASSNTLILAKAMKLAQSVLLSVDQPTVALLRSYARLRPGKGNADAMSMYLVSLRKLLEQCALSSPASASRLHTTSQASNNNNDNNDDDDDDDSNKDYRNRSISSNNKTDDLDAAAAPLPSRVFELNARQSFFVEALPIFADSCLQAITDAPTAVATASLQELAQLLQRTFSPHVVESDAGRAAINELLSRQLLSLLKPVYQRYWGITMELLQTVFQRLQYVKRVKDNHLLFTARFPAVVFLLKVLHKMRVMDDAQLNGKVERAMVSVASGMSMREFCEIVPFDICAAHAAEVREEMGGSSATAAIVRAQNRRSADSNSNSNEDVCDDESKCVPAAREAAAHRSVLSRAPTADELWSTSYVLNIIRRAASHDSLPFFVEHFFPMIQYCSRAAVLAEKEQRGDEFTRWSALLLQLWRVCVGFCHYPLDITVPSFRDVARQLVGLFTNSAFVDTAATALHEICCGYYKLAQLEPMFDEDQNVYHYNDDSSSDDEDDEDEDSDSASASVNYTRERYTSGGRSGAGLPSARQRGKRARRRLRKTGLEEDVHFLALHDPDWEPHVYHNIRRTRAREVCERILRAHSAIIMPKLCNTFATHESTAVLRAIASFAAVCEPGVMTTILQSILSTSAQVAADGSHNSSNNESPRALAMRRVVLDIACAVVGQLSVEQMHVLFANVVEPVLCDEDRNATDATQTSGAAQAVVISKNSKATRLLQKKAYKLLYAMFEQRSRDMLPLLQRVAEALSQGRSSVTRSGLKMRLRCLSWALDACKMYNPDAMPQTIRAVVTEVILCARERAGGVRVIAMDLLDKMQRYQRSNSSSIQVSCCGTNTDNTGKNSKEKGVDGASKSCPPLLHLILAGLCGTREEMVAGALVALAKVVHMTYLELTESDLTRVVEIAVRLMESTMPEVRSAAAVFARMTLKLAKRHARVLSCIKPALPRLLHAIAVVTSQPGVSSSTRMQMRVLLEKCLKRFGYDTLDPIFPLGSKNFLRYTHKMLRQSEKKAEQAMKKRQHAEQESSGSVFDRLFLCGGGADRAAGLTDAAAAGEAEDLLQAGALNSFVARHTATQSYAAALMGRSRPLVVQADRWGSGGENESHSDEDEYDTIRLEMRAADQKLHIISREDDRRAAEQGRRQALADRLLRRQAAAMANSDALNSDAVGAGRPGKRGRGDGDDVERQDLENEELILRYGGGASGHDGGKQGDGHGRRRGAAVAAMSSSSSSAAVAAATAGGSMHHLVKLREQKAETQRIKRQRVEEDIRKGDEFVGRGEGDVKRGGVDPFAYVPLNRRYMNRRHARQAVQRFEVIASRNLKGAKAKGGGRAGASSR